MFVTVVHFVKHHYCMSINYYESLTYKKKICTENRGENILKMKILLPKNKLLSGFLKSISLFFFFRSFKQKSALLNLAPDQTLANKARKYCSLKGNEH